MTTRSNTAGLLRQPVVQFAIIGALLALLFGVTGGGAGDAERQGTITVTAAHTALLRAQWTARWNRPPTPEELQGLIEQQVRETVLYREAVAMGLDRDDAVIRRMLGQKLERLYRDILELSLSPTDQQLAEYLGEYVDRYTPPDLITISTVFVDPDLREDDTLEDADRILAELRGLEQPTQGLAAYGDRFMLQTYYPERSLQDIGKLFGVEFARQVFELPEGEWHGPVLSGYGVHLVYVQGRRSFPAPALEQVKEQVRQDWIDDERRTLLDNYIADLLDRYEVIVEQPTSTARAMTAVGQRP